MTVSNGRRVAVMWVVVLGGLAASPLAGAQTPPDDEMKKLERELAKDLPPAPAKAPPPAGGGVLGKIMPDISLVLDVAGAYFHGEPDQRGGHDPKDTGFTFQQLELTLESNVDPWFRLRASLVFSLDGVEVEEAFGSTLRLPGGLKVRVGQLMNPFGRINTTHPHAWAFADIPLVNAKLLGPDGSRGLGGELSWLVPVPWFLELTVVVGDASGDCCARSFVGGDPYHVEEIGDLLYTAAIRQFFDLGTDWSLSLGLSGQFGPNTTGDGNRSAIYGVDLYLRYRPVASVRRTAVSLQAEWMLRTRQVPDGLLQDMGLYAQLVWNITPRWEIGGRYEWVQGNPGDALDPEWTGDRQRAAVEATFYPSEFSRIRLQANADLMPGRADPVWGAILAVELTIGAHAAHSF